MPQCRGPAQRSLEQTLWDAADKMRGNLEAAEYKHIALGLVFLKYVSDAFEQPAASSRRPRRTLTLSTSSQPRTAPRDHRVS